MESARRQMRPGPARAIAVWIWALPLVLGACVGAPQSSAARFPLCKPAARQLVASTLKLRPAGVATVPSTGNNAMPQCSFKARLARGGPFYLTVNVDTSPQPYAVLSRTIVERQQVFSPQRLVPAPVAVMGLGLLASWFPDARQLMSTDGARLVTVTVRWSAAPQGQESRFATWISRLYLGKSRPALAKLYP